MFRSQPSISTSQELSDPTSNVVEFRPTTSDNAYNQNELADLSELLAQYDSVKRQQEKVHFRREHKGRQRSSQQHLEAISNVAAAVFDDPHTDNAVNTANGDDSRHQLKKPQLYPMMPLFPELPPDTGDLSFDTFRTDWMNDKKSQSFGLKITNGPKMADSGIEVINPKIATLSMGSSSITSVSTINNTSDGYSSDSSLSSNEHDLTILKPVGRSQSNKSPVKA